MDTDIQLYRLKGRWWPLCCPQPSMFSLASGCCSWLCKLRQPVRKVTVLVLGLDNAGKTSTVRGILKAPLAEVTPTLGCVQLELRVDSFQVTLLDVGGGPEGRGTWRDHYSKAHGIVFVVDSSDAQRLQEARDLLAHLLMHPRVAGKPLLVIANKQDKPKALLGSELVEALSLETLVNQSRSLCHIEPSSALLDARRCSERKTLRGLRWLLRAVCLDYHQLCARVARDCVQPPAPEGPERRGRAERGHGRPREDGIRCSRTPPPKEEPPRSEEKASLPRGKLQPLQNILKKESRLKRRARRKKQVKIKDAVNDGDEEERPEVRTGAEQETEPSPTWHREGKAGSAAAALLPSNRVGLNRSVRVTEDTPEQPDSRQNEKRKPKKGKPEKKKKTKTVKKKNKINSEEVPTAHPQPVDLSTTFDLYRKAILALKARQDQNH
uniref:ADP-ribosylation factor-like 13A n=1 Tax=Lepisosteus oculatus TaxID=7918 RepID=W5NDX6_LEPOC|nr:PREDICTED: ADP-ribosylation factor-like protein 13A [Lepisosteus oculatus]